MFTPMTTPPTLCETIELFTLADDQARLLALLATDTQKRMHKGIPTREYADQPLRVLGTGGPCTGKTHVLAAYKWHAFHHHNANAIRKASYTWRAAHHLNRPMSQHLHASFLVSTHSRGKTLDNVTNPRLQANLHAWHNTCWASQHAWSSLMKPP